MLLLPDWELFPIAVNTKTSHFLQETTPFLHSVPMVCGRKMMHFQLQGQEDNPGPANHRIHLSGLRGRAFAKSKATKRKAKPRDEEKMEFSDIT